MRLTCGSFLILPPVTVLVRLITDYLMINVMRLQKVRQYEERSQENDACVSGSAFYLGQDIENHILFLFYS